jgi:muramidase (phage lysozyme)
VNDWNKLFDYFGSSKQFEVVSYFNYTIMLSAPLQLSFVLQQIDLSNYGLKKTSVNEQPAIGTSNKKSAIFKISTEQNVPIVIKKDVTPLIIDLKLDNVADGKIKTLNHLYVLLPGSLLINAENKDIKEITTTLSPKVLREIRKRCRYEEMNYKIYELDTQSELYKTLTGEVAENNKLATNIILDVHKNILFKENNYPQDVYMWIVSDYNYVVTKTQTLTLSDKIYNDIQSKRSEGVAADATYVNIKIDDSGFAEVADTSLKPEIKAFLDVIASIEGGYGAKGYYTINGGSTFTDCTHHPGYRAAGRYQFLPATWEGLADKYKLNDFCPINQDAGAIYLIKSANAYDDILNGNINSAMSKLNGIWVSLPGGSQNMRSTSEIVSTYNTRLAHYQTQIQTLASG